jgi:sec-independent protein translocase protein TatB
MFDIGWSEMAIIAFVALLVFGPKELPNALRTGAKWMRTARKLAREFQSSVDQLVREAELEEAKKLVTDVKTGGIARAIEKTVDPEGEVKSALDPKNMEPGSGSSSTPSPAIGTTDSVPAPEATKVEPQALSAPDDAAVPMPIETRPEPEPLAAPDGESVPVPPEQAADKAASAGTGPQDDSLKKTA